MATIFMNSNTGITGNWTLGSGAVVALTNGIGQVNPQDVPVALRSGWTVQAGQNWPGAAVKHMSIPAGSNWPTNGTATFPDGTTAAITAGAALIPIAFANLFASYGWTQTPNTGFGE